MIEHPSSLVTAFARHMRTIGQTAADTPNEQAPRFPHPIGPVGTTARLIVGLLLIGLIVYGQLVATKHFTPAAWALGLLGFPALVLAWHWWWIRRHPAPLRDTGILSFLLSLVLPLAVYMTGWIVPALGFTSDATLLFVGFSLLLSALRGSAGCEFLVLSNWLRRLHASGCLGAARVSPLEMHFGSFFLI